MAGAPPRETRAAAELLDRAQVPGDGVLFTHSAFRRLGAQGFRAEAFIEGLLNYMRAGTLVMPTMSWRVVTPANPWFDELETPSHVGVLAERFRLDYATHRSLHPTHSVAAFGPLAQHLTLTHHCEDTPCGLTSPYGKARQTEAHIVLLGIGLERCTAIHHAEEMIAPDVYLSPPELAETYCRDLLLPRARRHRSPSAAAPAPPAQSRFSAVYRAVGEKRAAAPRQARRNAMDRRLPAGSAGRGVRRAGAKSPCRHRAAWRAGHPLSQAMSRDSLLAGGGPLVVGDAVAAIICV
jgi:aminoglycoside N3'-acetyltransferase